MSAGRNDSESEYETDSEDEVEILKPVFVPKNKRITVVQQEEKQLQEQLAEQKKKELHKKRVDHTRSLVAESIQRIDEQKQQIEDDAGSDTGCPDDTDNPDEDVEFEAWKVREILRLKRDAEERHAAEQEKAELLRRRNMTDEERLEDDIKNGRLKDTEEEKPKWNFMQKYYHKGVFYLDSTSVKDGADVRKKDYAAEPTLEDKIDKERLPAVLQVKNFGKRSRTKYTHLVDQDTTLDNKNKRRANYQMDERLMNKYLDKRSGTGKL